MKKSLKRFPNGFANWQETHFEIVRGISRVLSQDRLTGTVKDTYEAHTTKKLTILFNENLSNKTMKTRLKTIYLKATTKAAKLGYVIALIDLTIIYFKSI